MRRVDAAESSRRMAMKAADALEGEIRERFSWETRESGVIESPSSEESGRQRRRQHAPEVARRSTGELGHVDASMRIPAPERLRIVGGVDVERARRNGAGTSRREPLAVLQQAETTDAASGVSGRGPRTPDDHLKT